MKKIKNRKALADDVYDQLVEEILKMEPGNNRLPSEEGLCDILGVSRVTIREALKHLVVNGAVTTIHGQGNFAHPEVLKVPNRLDMNSNFFNMLEEQYRDVRLSESWKEHEMPDSFVAGEFGDSVTEIVRGDWLYIADEKIRIYARFSFPEEVMKKGYDLQQVYESLPDFSSACLRSRIDYCILKLYIKFDAEAAERMGVAPERPLQCWNESIFDIDDNKIGAAEVFIHPDNLEIAVVSKME